MDEKIELTEEVVEDTAAEVAEEAQEKKPAEKKKIRKLEAELEALAAEKAALETAISEANDKYTRLFAEYDNYRKRSAKEREGVYTDAYADAIQAILPVLDNMERALQYKDAQGGEDNLAKGLEMIMKSFAESLSKMGVTEIAALGEHFDPNLHNAIMHVDDEQYGEEEIVEVFMKGYAKGDRVIRHSVVKVAN